MSALQLPFWSLPELIAACICWAVWVVGLSLRVSDPGLVMVVRSYRLVTLAVNLILTALFFSHSGLVSAHDALWATYLVASSLPAIAMRFSRRASGQAIVPYEVAYWLVSAACFGGLLFAPEAFVGPDRVSPLGFPQANALWPGVLLTVAQVTAVTWSIWERFRRGSLGPIGGLRWLTAAWLVYNAAAVLEQVGTSGWLPLPPTFWIGALALTLEFARLIHAHQSATVIALGRANAALTELSSDLERRVADRTLALERLAMHDPLTGLANRAHAERFLQRAATAAAAHDRAVAVLMADLNRFKNINDTAGHPVGDAVLREVARRFAAQVPETGLLARLGGDEFLVVLPDLERHAAPSLSASPTASNVTARAEHVSRALIESLTLPIHVDGTEFFVGTSIGIAAYPHDGSDATALARVADVAMYRAKSEGLGYRVFDALLDADISERDEIERALRHALETDPAGHFRLEYQPIVRLRTAEITGFEALLRWNDEVFPLSPAQFIPVAEESRLIVPLGNWVLQEACRQAALWEREGHAGGRVSVNVSTHQFERPDFVDTVKRTLDATHLPPERLTLELLESVMVDRFDTTAAKIAQLRHTGLRLALDDFGTGYSSLSYLHHLTFDTLKVDRSFTRLLGSVNRPRALMAAALSIAQELGMVAVVEGVETPEQAQELELLGCQHAQGFLFSRSVSAAEATRMLRHGLRAGSGNARQR